MFALVPFIKGDFVVEYRGEIITLIEAELRREANQDTLCSTSSGRTRSGGTFFFILFYQYILKLQ